MYINTLNTHLRQKYGCKVYKLALSTGCSCPNRDGTIGSRGCIFCDGAGAFAESGSIDAQLAAAKPRVAAKVGNGAKYIAYFQSFTNTYGDVNRLYPLFCEAAKHEEIVALSIATRPDCLPDEILEMLSALRRKKPLWVELGLQTIHRGSIDYIRRGYENEVFDAAVAKLKAIDAEVVVHQILGLPGEDARAMRQTAEYIGRSGADGIKFHLLYVLNNTDLARDFESGKITALGLDEYISALEDCLRSIPREMVVHRMTGDGAKRDLLSPLWSGDKKRVLNTINSALRRDNIEQGEWFSKI